VNIHVAYGYARATVLTVIGTLTLLFLFLPVLTILVYAFNSGNFLVNWEGLGTRWFSIALATPAITSALGVSVKVALMAVVLGAIIGTSAGYAMARAKPWVSVVILVMLLGALAIPEIVLGLGDVLWFQQLRVPNGILAMVLGHALAGSALFGFVVRARLANADPKLEEAAADLGASPFVALRTVILPYLRPALISGALLAFAFSLDDVIISQFVSSPRTTTLPVYIFGSAKAGVRGDVVAMAAMMFLVTLVLLSAVGLLLRRFGGSRKSRVLMMAGQSE
jgi:ABC-type spermidine/putrescine transport system permease subunit II